MNKIDELVKKINLAVSEVEDDRYVDKDEITDRVLGNNIRELVNEYEYGEYKKLFEYSKIKKVVNIYNNNVSLVFNILRAIINSIYLFREDLTEKNIRDLSKNNKLLGIDLMSCIKISKLNDLELNNVMHKLIRKEKINDNIVKRRIYELIEKELKAEVHINHIRSGILRSVIEEGKENYKKDIFNDLINNDELFKEICLDLMKRDFYSQENENYINIELETRVTMKISKADLNHIYETKKEILLDSSKYYYINSCCIYLEFMTEDERIKFAEKLIEEERYYTIVDIMSGNCRILNGIESYMTDMLEAYMLMSKINNIDNLEYAG